MKFPLIALLISTLIVGSCQSAQVTPGAQPQVLEKWQGQLFARADNISTESCPDLGEISLDVVARGDDTCKSKSCKITGQITWKFFGEREEQISIQGEVDNLGNYRFAGLSDEKITESFGQFGDDAVSATLAGAGDCFTHYTLAKI